MRSIFLLSSFIILACSQASSCTVKNIGCLSCLNESNICQQCNTSYFLNGSTCSPCPTGCVSCTINNQTNATSCSNCSINYSLASNYQCYQCPSKKYSNGGTSACRFCPANCSISCMGNFNSSLSVQCLKCSANYTSINGSCLACPTGQMSNGGNSSCYPIGCATYNGSICYTCENNYYLFNISCLACSAGSGTEGGNASYCFSCTQGCSSCTPNACVTCFANWTLNSNKTCSCSGNFSLSANNTGATCTCPYPFIMNGTCMCPSKMNFNGSACLCTAPYCANCTAGDSCFLCITGYVSVGAYCVPFCQIQNCLNCNYNFQCINCSNSLFPSSNGTTCVQCSVPNCQSCLIDNVCGFCQAGLILSNATGTTVCVTCNISNCLVCSANNTCYQCAQGYLNNNNLTCSLCLPPCAICNNQNTCLTCLSPYYLTPFANGTCFICNVQYCTNCSTTNPNICNQCNLNYALTNSSSVCQAVCMQNCINCMNNTVCLACTTYYYVNSNNTCSLCNNTPQCMSCNATQCLSCISGYYLNGTQCLACPDYCASCSSANICNTANQIYSSSFTLVQTQNQTYVANCDTGCISCMGSNPMFCLTCASGFYIGPNAGVCVPCDLNSNCMQCSTVNSSLCITCYPGSFLSLAGTCTLCSPFCVTCSQSNCSICTSCPIGLILVNGSCTYIQYLACAYGCAICAVVNGTSVCSFCVSGWILSYGNCVPCQSGCAACSPTNLGICFSCLSGYYTNSTNGCSPCSPYCITCSIQGCTECQIGYQLSSNFTCVLECLLPCVSCLENNPYLCTSCLYGFVSSAIYVDNCGVNVSCNPEDDCTYCPPGTVMLTNNSLTMFLQRCVGCFGICYRCQESNISVCTACYPGTYLLNGSCLQCPQGCYKCVSPTVCLICGSVYVPSIITSNVQPVVCLACLSPCQTCSFSVSFCTTCVTNYTLIGTQCITSFNFQIVTVLNAPASTFNKNYIAFLNTTANAVQSSTNIVTVLSIVYGSVTVTMLVSTNYAPGSPSAISQQKKLQSALSGYVAGMQVASTVITTNGGQNGGGGDDDNISNPGLSKTTIIIISIFSPILIIGIIAGIAMIVYTRREKAQQVDALQLKSMKSDRQSINSQKKSNKSNLI